MLIGSRVVRCCLLGVLSASSVASGQQSVGATSGSPAAIARVRAAFAAIERDLPRYRRTTHELQEFSLEGGELVGFHEGQTLRKMTARLFGEMWRGSESYYFSNGRLVFIHVVHERYDRPMSGRVESRLEQRFYFDDERLIRHVRTQSPSRRVRDLSSFDSKLEELLTNARLFAACAAATGVEPSACTAPER